MVLKPVFMASEHYFDDLIIGEIRKNNPVALRELYKTHYPMILNLVLFNSGTEQEAKDIYQEAVINLYEKAQSESFVLTCKIKTYLYAVCRRLWLKKLHEKKRFHGNIEESETFLEIEEEMATVEANERRFHEMSRALNDLGQPCRSILEDYYFKDLSMETISEKFGYTNSDNAKNQKYKCLQRLKKIFFANYNEDNHE